MTIELWPVGPALRPQEFTGAITGGEIETVPYSYLRFTSDAGEYVHTPIDLGEIKTGALLVTTSTDGPLIVERRHRLDAGDPWGAWTLHGGDAFIARHVQVRLRPVGVPRVVHMMTIRHVSAV